MSKSSAVRGLGGRGAGPGSTLASWLVVNRYMFRFVLRGVWKMPQAKNLVDPTC